MTMHHFWMQNTQIALKTIFFGNTIKILFVHLLAPFLVQNFKQIIRTEPELRQHIIFGTEMAQLPWMIIFWENHWCNFDVPLCLFDCGKLKKSFEQIQSYEPKEPICPKVFFSKNHEYKFDVPLGPFNCGKFLKDPQSRGGGGGGDMSVVKFLGLSLFSMSNNANKVFLASLWIFFIFGHLLP